MGGEGIGVDGRGIDVDAGRAGQTYPLRRLRPRLCLCPGADAGLNETLVLPLVQSKINAFVRLFFKNAGLQATAIVCRCLLMFICVFSESCIAWEGFGLSGGADSWHLGHFGHLCAQINK